MYFLTRDLTFSRRWRFKSKSFVLWRRQHYTELQPRRYRLVCISCFSDEWYKYYPSHLSSFNYTNNIRLRTQIVDNFLLITLPSNTFNLYFSLRVTAVNAQETFIPCKDTNEMWGSLAERRSQSDSQVSASAQSNYLLPRQQSRDVTVRITNK
jgi:hypothetical protein